MWDYRLVPCHAECTQGSSSPGWRGLIFKEVLLISGREDAWVNRGDVQEEQRDPDEAQGFSEERAEQGGGKGVDAFHRIRIEGWVPLRDGWGQETTDQPRVKQLGQLVDDVMSGHPAVHGQRPR